MLSQPIAAKDTVRAVSSIGGGLLNYMMPAFVCVCVHERAPMYCTVDENTYMHVFIKFSCIFC